MGSFVGDIYRIPAPNMYRKIKQMSNDEYEQHCIKQMETAFISQVDPESLAAIIIEPIQGEGGFITIPKSFLQKIRETCTKHGIVMIADEIQSGAGRTGKFLAIEHSGIVPDIVCMAKSIGGGMPISAITGKAEILDAPHLGSVGGTYGGSPVVCVAAIEAVKITSSAAFLERSIAVGEMINKTMTSWMQKYSCIGDVRGAGSMQLIEFVKDRDTKEPDMDTAMAVIKEAIANGVILIRAGLFSNCIRLLPPVVINDEDLKEGLQVLENAIRKICSK